MKAKFVFEDLKKDGKSVYNTEIGWEYTLGSFHSGTTFNCEIQLDQDEEKDIKEMIEKGITPHFYLIS